MFQTGDLDEFHSIANAQADQAMRNEKRESEPLVLIDKGSDIGYSVCETARRPSLRICLSSAQFRIAHLLQKKVWEEWVAWEE